MLRLQRFRIRVEEGAMAASGSSRKRGVHSRKLTPHRCSGLRKRREEALIQRAASDGNELMRRIAEQTAALA
jgi:hypothetical protein